MRQSCWRRGPGGSPELINLQIGFHPLSLSSTFLIGLKKRQLCYTSCCCFLDSGALRSHHHPQHLIIGGSLHYECFPEPRDPPTPKKENEASKGGRPTIGKMQKPTERDNLRDPIKLPR